MPKCKPLHGADNRQRFIISLVGRKASFNTINGTLSVASSQSKVQEGQGFSYLSEVGARGLLNLRKKAFGPSNLEN